jgi:hypothetical protein
MLWLQRGGTAHKEDAAVENLNKHYLDEVERQFRGYKRMAEGAVAQVNDEELFRAIDPEANSIAVVMKHIGGNLRSRFRDFLSSDGEKPDRNRDQEFIIEDRPSREELLQIWEGSWNILFHELNALLPDDLERMVTIRGQPHTVLQALNRQLAHYAYHVGQIVLLAKHFRGPEWQSLSIPKGHSEAFNTGMAKRRSM